MQHKLNIGLLSLDSNFPAWQYALLTEIANSDYAYLGVRIRIDAEADRGANQGLASSLHRVFQKYENKKPIAYDACEIVNASELLSEVDCITLPVKSAIDSAREMASKIEQIKTRRLDVILALGDISSIEPLVGASKYGIWFYDYSYGKSDRVDTSWIGLGDVLRRRPHLRSALIVRGATFDGDRIAYDSYSSVDPLSHAVTRSEHLWKIRAFVPRTLRKLYADGGERFLEEIRDAEPVSQPGSCISMKLRGPVVLLLLARYALWRIGLKITRNFFTEKWILMFQLGGDSGRLVDYTRICPPEDWFWADPFVIEWEKQYFIYFEEASIESGKGHIAAICMDERGDYGEPKRILESPYHLSYPFIFEWQKNRYMTVESADNRTIEVYRCIEFPYNWQFECTLMENIEAYDATLFEHGNTWWLFANVREHKGASTWDELCIYSSDNPLSNGWRPHPMNPVISDVRSARPAGKIFEKDGRIYRPSQNSSYRYGYGLNFNEILELTKTTYNERLIECFEPNWDRSIRALHTFSAAGKLACIDAIYRTGKYGRKDV